VNKNFVNSPQYYRVCSSNPNTVEFVQRICFANPQVAG